MRETQSEQKGFPIRNHRGHKEIAQHSPSAGRKKPSAPNPKNLPNQRPIKNILQEGWVPGGLCQLSVRLWILARVMISWFVESSPVSGSDSAEPAWDFLSPSLSAPPLLILSPSLSLSLSVSLCLKMK